MKDLLCLRQVGLALVVGLESNMWVPTLILLTTLGLSLGLGILIWERWRGSLQGRSSQANEEHPRRVAGHPRASQEG